MPKTVTDKLFNYLLNDISGDNFETLAQKLFGSEYDEEYVPLGGMHDGGADGYYLPKVYADKVKPNTFFQFRITNEKKAKSKILETIQSLIKVGRSPKQLFYATTEQIPKQDILISEIFNEYKILLQIRDREKIKQIINSNSTSNKIFLETFAAEINSVANSASNLKGRVNECVQDPAIFAFLDFELMAQNSKEILHDKILDSLIYWSLRDTDPDLKKFKSKNEIIESIKLVLPAAASFLLPRLPKRLVELCRKDAGGGERVRHHKNSDHFCLPFEMRTLLAERAVEETSLQAQFLDSIKQRVQSTYTSDLKTEEITFGVKLVFEAVHEYFVEQGLILAAFLSKKIADINCNPPQIRSNDF